MSDGDDLATDVVVESVQGRREDETIADPERRFHRVALLSWKVV